MDETDYDVLVLGIGNLLFGDDGVGVRVVEEVEGRYAFPDRVRVMDGGTQGLYLVPYVRDAVRLLVFDAIDDGLAPGAIKVLCGEELARAGCIQKIDMHQVSLQDVLFAVAAIGGRLEEVVLVGIQAARLDVFSDELSSAVRAAIPEALAVGLEQLAEWGVEARPRNAAPAAGVVA